MAPPMANGWVGMHASRPALSIVPGTGVDPGHAPAVTQMKGVPGILPIRVGVSSTGVIQRAQPAIRRRQNTIPRAPTGVTMAGLRQLDGDQPDAPKLDLGTTSNPVGFRAPTFQINVTSKNLRPRGKAKLKHQQSKGYYANVRLTGEADPGHVYSAYLNKGTYDTGMRWATGGYYDTAPATSRMVTRAGLPFSFDTYTPAHMHVSQNISDLSQQAEQEHLDDIRHAYGLTLGAAETAIRAAQTRTQQRAIGPFKTADLAKAAARNLIYNALPTESQAMGHDFGQWGAKYQELTAKTGWRDGHGWHTFSVAETADTYGNRAWGWWNTAKSVDAIATPGVRIGQVSTNRLVNFRSQRNDPY